MEREEVKTLEDLNFRQAMDLFTECAESASKFCLDINSLDLSKEADRLCEEYGLGYASRSTVWQVMHCMMKANNAGWNAGFDKAKDIYTI